MSTQNEERIFGQVRDILTANFNIPAEKITPQATFRGNFGMDSLDIVDLVFFLQKTFGVSADLEEYRELHTMQKLVRFVAQKTTG
jgi:acyl carrier protein